MSERAVSVAGQAASGASGGPPKIGFVLLSPHAAPIPSTRIAVLNMLPLLRAAGFDAQVAFEPASATEKPDVSSVASRLLAEKYDVVVFQKVHGESVERLSRDLRAAGVRTAWLVCDLVNPAMAGAVDATIVVTDYLKSLYPQALQPSVHVVHDGVERPQLHNPDAGSRGPSDHNNPLRAVLVTSAALDHVPVLGRLPPWLEVTIVGRYPPAADRLSRLRAMRWQWARLSARERPAYLRFLLDRRVRCMAWHPEQVYDAMRQADIGIIPIDRTPDHHPGQSAPDWKVKSENRLTMKMAMGLPVIATPIPAYEPVVVQGENGFLADTREQWLESLDALREPALRRKVGAAARASVLERYSMQHQADRLTEVLRGLLAG